MALPESPVNSTLFLGRSIFSGLAYYFFLISCMKLEYKRKMGVTEPIFRIKFLLCLKWGKLSVFEPKINSFELFSKSVNWIFLKLYLMEGISEYFGFLRKVFIVPLFVPRKWAIFNFFPRSFPYFF